MIGLCLKVETVIKDKGVYDYYKNVMKDLTTKGATQNEYITECEYSEIWKQEQGRVAGKIANNKKKNTSAKKRYRAKNRVSLDEDISEIQSPPEKRRRLNINEINTINLDMSVDDNNL